jgi:hypothetical protein
LVLVLIFLFVLVSVSVSVSVLVLVLEVKLELFDSFLHYIKVDLLKMLTIYSNLVHFVNWVHK